MNFKFYWHLSDCNFSTDDIGEAYVALRTVVMRYLGIDESTAVQSGASCSLPDSVQDFGGGLLTSAACIPPAKGRSAPAPQRPPWSRPSLHSFGRPKTVKERSQLSFFECLGKNSLVRALTNFLLYHTLILELGYLFSVIQRGLSNVCNYFEYVNS